MDKSKPCLVTGGSGYIGLHVVSQLLDAGYTVHATVRDLQNDKKVAPLRDLRARPGQLQLFEADLLRPGSFAQAMKGCSVVFHVASPFPWLPKIRDGQKECVEPAVQGTKNVLDSVNLEDSVKRVVLTSSMGAVYGDYVDARQMDGNVLHERYWNTTSSVTHNPYAYSKVLAEKEAWAAAAAQSRWDLVVLCPGLVLGPSLSPSSASGSLNLLDDVLRGRHFLGVPPLSFFIVDVRDVAVAHIRATERPQAHGRYLVLPTVMTSIVDISRFLRTIYEGPSWWLPTWQLPKFLLMIMGPRVGLSRKWIGANMGIEFTSDNSRSVRELGIDYTRLEQTLKDHYESWKKQEEGRR
ncbi:hypothetical protein VTK73DRAFT_4674 [Phialemonium thermophilum]|uniref:NAD-dependent epimerase/dehydratase domain-containing protein n=1 Tax=Phialemonium thermophilum TaxID=223376 RepID=A0ABR3V6V3_9PEZI